MSYTYVENIAQSAKPSQPRSRVYRSGGKRIGDIVAVLLIAPIAFLVILAAWLATTLNGGKAIYSQPRIGIDGRVFRCWKIRTMVTNAEQVLEDLIASDPTIGREWQAHQKLENDPRITALGKVLRQLSIDELPQLWNVLVGDMSMLGPRPFTPLQKEIYDATGSRAYYRLRPGISGPWQVSCRHESEFQERAVFDDNYFKNLSFWNDFKLSLRTIAVVLKGTGK